MQAQNLNKSSKKALILSNKRNFINQVNNDRRLKPKSKHEYIRIIKNIPDKYLIRCNVESYVRYLHQKSNKTISLYVSVYRRYMKFCKVDYKDMIIYTSNRGEHLKDSFTPKELSNMVRSSDQFMGALISILYLTGLRIGELISSDLIRENRNYILVFIGKGKIKAEQFLISKKQKKLCTHLDVFFSPEFKHRRVYYSIWRDFKELKEKNNINSKRLTIHSIRHSAAERFQRKYGESVAQRMLRHRDFRTTEIYINTSSTKLPV